MSHNLDMNAGRESDGCVVPTKCPNKGGGLSPAEGMEESQPTKENTGQTTASQMQSWGNALNGLQRVREAAKRDKRLRFTALLHHVSIPLLANSFYALKRQAAPGVDGLTWQEYEKDLDKRLEELHSRVHRGFFVLRKTIRERLLAKLKQVKAALRVRMHQPLAKVGRWLKSVVQGYFNYHAVPGNLASLRRFRLEVRKRWLHVIRRRSQRSRMTWELLERFAVQWLPIPKVLHPYTHLRFDATHPR